jgi:hypothetical protein
MLGSMVGWWCAQNTSMVSKRHLLHCVTGLVPESREEWSGALSRFAGCCLLCEREQRTSLPRRALWTPAEPLKPKDDTQRLSFIDCENYQIIPRCSTSLTTGTWHV